MASLMLPAASASGQEKCVTPEVFFEAVEHECRESAAKASQYDRCRGALAEMTQYRDELHGQIQVYEKLEKERLDAVRAEAVLRERWTWKTWVVLVGAAALTGFGVGIAL